MELWWQYGALAASAFTSATVLPGTSEAAFLAFLHAYPQHWLAALLVAGLFNGLGSMVSYAMGYWLPVKKRPSEKIMAYLQKWGVWTLLLAWVPVVGDGLPLAAGWLRLNPWLSSVVLVAGKFLRYGFLLGAARALF
ncbi:YqaA family protein [Neisseria weaveri]|uniref:Membrane protein n=1 Tax=Neisseria weaveri TaxID=28091 RepID=A0A448VL74_9NEIS|nr:DedA family protein [Neisseria weaveri]EGV36077.1 inner membrane protein YqaA [Neisseria weaveri ATCC 51223]EGV38750.1 inner membrane protein YqaA [Neisseria weaveri LMG 5135]SAY51451.1 membrane protein [Neisseria weaveri]VEJ50501.1 membrane protein [Neisseria weaveri]